MCSFLRLVRKQMCSKSVKQTKLLMSFNARTTAHDVINMLLCCTKKGQTQT